MKEPAIKSQQVNSFAIFCWCFFDWAHSAFPTVIITFIFGTFFTQSVAPNPIIGTAYWGWALGLSGILVAILSPIFGSIADYTFKQKRWLGIFVFLNIISTALLVFTQPTTSWILWALIFVALANLFYELTQVFYNAMLVYIAPKDKVGRISGWGWGLGYFGGLLCLILALLLFVQGSWISQDKSLNIRATTLLVAGWFFVFAIPLFIFTPEKQNTSTSIRKAMNKGIRMLLFTLKNIFKHKNIFYFLIAHLLYIDGLNTLFAFAAIFAAKTFHMNYTQILLFAILLNLTAGLGAAIFAFIDDKRGPKFTICFSLTGMIVTGSVILLLKNIFWFWVLSAILGLFVGPTQAASRSYMAHVVPKNLTNQMFGIYQFSGRITAFVGPILVGTLTELFQSQRLGMSVIFILMFLGLLILLKVKPVYQPTNQ